MKSHVFFIIEVKEHSGTNWEASCNVGNGKATVISNNREDAIKLAVHNAFETHLPQNEAA